MKAIELIIFLCLMYSPLSPAFAVEKPEWLVCETDTDCVLVGGCVMRAVNKNYQAEVQDYSNKYDSIKNCNPKKIEDFQVSCVDMKCVASPKQAIEK